MLGFIWEKALMLFSIAVIILVLCMIITSVIGGAIYWFEFWNIFIGSLIDFVKNI